MPTIQTRNQHASAHTWKPMPMFSHVFYHPPASTGAGVNCDGHVARLPTVSPLYMHCLDELQTSLSCHGIAPLWYIFGSYFLNISSLVSVAASITSKACHDIMKQVQCEGGACVGFQNESFYVCRGDLCSRLVEVRPSLFRCLSIGKELHCTAWRQEIGLHEY